MVGYKCRKDPTRQNFYNITKNRYGKTNTKNRETTWKGRRGGNESDRWGIPKQLRVYT